MLRKWQRASGDFKSTVELNPSDKDAENNADFVDRNIAKLIDIQQMMMENQWPDEGELRQKLKKLKGKIPQELAPPGGGGSMMKEEGEKLKEPKAGMKEGPSDGKERQLTPEEAERFLGMLGLQNRNCLWEWAIPVKKKMLKGGTGKMRNYSCQPALLSALLVMAQNVIEIVSRFSWYHNCSGKSNCGAQRHRSV